MRKTERLDQILVRLGYVTSSQIGEAVSRQKERGGRIGTNLVELGHLTEEQLFDGLVEQFRIPTIAVDESIVQQKLIERLPDGLLEDSLVVPLAWNEQLGVLSVAVANPSDDVAIERVRAVFNARKVRVSLAPEGVLADLVMELTGGTSTDAGVRLVALPELFETVAEDEGEARPAKAPAEPERSVLMVSEGAVRRDFLPGVFRAEGYDLVVASAVEEVRSALRAGPDFVLVSDRMADRLEEWVAGGLVPAPSRPPSVFSSVSGSLLNNPVPYGAVAASARAAVQALAEYRCLTEGVAPPYTLMATDVEALSARVPLGRLARDGISLGLHLLLPVEAGTRIEPFRSFAATIELAHRIRFPWPIDTLLSQCLGLYLGRVDLNTVGDPREEVILAAQVLALVWFRHNLVDIAAEDPDEAMGELRGVLRQLAGRLATLDVIEEYLGLITERGGAEEGDPWTVLLVGGDRVARALGPAMTRVGTKVATAPTAAAAQSAAQDGGTDAIVVDHEVFGSETIGLCRILRVDKHALIYVLTDDPDPALVLNLLDIGVDDVFAPPHDFDVMAARVHRSLRSREMAEGPRAPEGQFSANFEAFSFLDLAQMLANGMKSVRVDLRSEAGEEAVLYFEKGRPVYAECGALTGPRAVYYVISWEDAGSFSVDDADRVPDPNIQESVEALLMEGVRLLDESRA